MRNSTSNDVEKIVDELKSTVLSIKGHDFSNKHVYMESNGFHLTSLCENFDNPFLIAAFVEVLVRLDEAKFLNLLTNWRRGQPGVIISYFLQEASKDHKNFLFSELTQRIYRVSKENKLFFELLENTASSLEAEEMARVVKKAYERSLDSVGVIFEILEKNPSEKAVPVLNALKRAIEYDNACSLKADIRHSFAKKYDKRITALIEKSETFYAENSLFQQFSRPKMPV